jgi:CubicO group peptidase (beta-lactamase class C family)
LRTGLRFTQKFFTQKLSVGILLVLGLLPAAAQRQSGWQEAAPAIVDIDQSKLEAFDREITSGQYGNVDGVLVIRCGKLVWDRSYPHDYKAINGGRTWMQQPIEGQYNYFNPDWHPFYRGSTLHTMQSATKTVTALTLGAAIKRGDFKASLDTPVLKYFDPAKVANVDERKRRMTLRHLLIMTSGLDWREDVPYGDPTNDSDRMEATRDWVQYVIDKPMAHEPGTVFAYSSGVSELLAHIFRRETGRNVDEYAAKFLFKPLGITSFHWKHTPMGLADTEGGLYLDVHDLARLGLLMLRQGNWRDRSDRDGGQIVSAEWIRQMVMPASSPTGWSIPVKYGFQTWLYGWPIGAASNATDWDKTAPLLVWGFSGFGGQRVHIIPQRDLIVVSTGWNIDPQGKSLPIKTQLDFDFSLGATKPCPGTIRTADSR